MVMRIIFPPPDPAQARRRAKIHNERFKMQASALNALGIAFTGAAFIFPVIRDGNLAALMDWMTWFGYR